MKKLTSNFQTVKSIVILFGRRTFDNFTQKWSTNVARQTIARLASTLITTATQSPAMYWFALSCFLFASRRVSELIRTRVSWTRWTLIDVETFIIHFEHSNGSVSEIQFKIKISDWLTVCNHLLWILDVSELCVTRVDIGYRHNSRHHPFIWSSTIEVRLCEFDWAWRFIGASRSMECKRFVCVVSVSNFNLICRLCVVSFLDIVRQPRAIPFVYLVEVRCVIFRQRVLRDGAQIAHIECVHRWDFLQMNWIIEVVQTECSRRKTWECFVEEAAIWRRVRTVWWEINGRSVDEWVGGDISNRWQEVIHHSRIVCVIDRRPNETTLQNIAPEKWSTQCHVMQMKQRRSIRKDRIDVDFFDVDQMWHRIFRQIEIIQMLNRAIVGRHFVHSNANFIKSISRLPFVLSQNADHQQHQKSKITSPNNFCHTHCAMIIDKLSLVRRSIAHSCFNTKSFTKNIDSTRAKMNLSK